MNKNLTKIENPDLDIDHSYRPDLFDYSGGYDEQPSIEFNDNLSDWIIAEAIHFYNLFSIPPNNKLCGTAVGSGNVGQGKDCTFNYIAWIINTAFKNKKLLRDEKPRELFGMYAGLFNEETLAKDMEIMGDIASNKKMTVADKTAMIDAAVDSWMTEKGEVMLRDSVLYLTEFWRYHDLRYPFKPINNMLSGVHKLKRHFRELTLGTIQLMSDLDKRRCLPYIDWHIQFRRSTVISTGFIGKVYKYHYNINTGRTTLSPMPVDIIKVDGARPVDELGEPFSIINNEYKGKDRFERKLIDAIKSDSATYEDLLRDVKFRGKAKPSILRVIKRLFLQKVITYGCFFKTYNSQSAARAF